MKSINKKYCLNRSEYGTHMILGKCIGRNKKVLDIGCNVGYLKRVSDTTNSFRGVDIDRRLLNKAKEINGYEDVYLSDLNQGIPKIKDKFDVLVFADILEHLIKPEIVLRSFIKRNLKQDGKVLISLPNIAHISIRINLLFGLFNYRESGILDKGHFHLYTRKTACEMMDKANLSVKDVYYSSNRFGLFLDKFNLFGNLLGYNLILVCQKQKS